VSHDLKTPLNSIENQTKLLIEKLGSPPLDLKEMEETLEIILKNSQFLHSNVQDILEYTKI
jgi:K+-sensing histidine kinase KdpD